MELRHLRYCITVAQTGSFSLAAARLGVAQQAVSRQIADLEWELGVKLFERGSRGTTLTPTGETFVREARGVLEQADRAASRARTQPGGTRLVIGYSHLSPQDLGEVGMAVADLHAVSPDVAVELRHIPTGAQVTALNRGEIDVAFGNLVSDDTDDTASEIFRGNAVAGVILPADHPFASRKILRLRDLAPWPMIAIVREVNPLAHDEAMTGLSDRGLVPNVAYIRAVGLSAIALVSSGYGWHLAPNSIKSQVASSANVVYRPFSDPVFPFGLCIRWDRAKSSPLVQRFVEISRRRRNPAADYLNAR
jgi:DNA-binding transcriptional LysR family regulator